MTLPQPSHRILPHRSNRLDRLPPYRFAVIGQRIAAMNTAGHDVIRLDMGNPDMPPPEHVVEALTRSARNPHHHGYSSYRGDAGFRQAVATYYQRRFGVQLDPDHEVLPLIGSKEGLVNLTLAYVDRGDTVLVPALNYPAYTMGTLMAGGDPIIYPLEPSDNFRPRLAAITDDLTHTKMMWINYPNNPATATLDLKDLQELVDFCRQHQILLCSDNPYVDITYDGYKAPSVMQAAYAKDSAIEFISLSKMFNMAGWRVGAAIASKEVIDTLLVVKSNVDTGHFKAIYDAASVALNDTPQTWLDARNTRYQQRRDKILATLPQIGLSAEKPRATMYVWAKLPDAGNGEAYCQAALEEAKVALTPGSTYGEAGQNYVRLAVGMEDDRLEEALSRLRNWYRNKQ